MISKASASFVRIAPRKVRYVMDLIRRKSVAEAHAILNGSPRRASEILRKLLNQAVDAAEKNSNVSANQLVVSKALADGGPMMKRFRAATMGRANRIRKRTSHIQLELDLSKKGAVLPAKTTAKTPAVKKAEAPAPAKKAKKAGTKKMVGAK